MWSHVEGNAQEFDVVVEGATPAERLAKQRRSLRKRLGMGGKMDELIDTSDLIEDEDLLVAEPVLAAGSTQKAASTEATELLSNMEGAQISCNLILQWHLCNDFIAMMMDLKSSLTTPVDVRKLHERFVPKS